MNQDWVIIRYYEDKSWAEEDAIRLHAIGLESRIEEIPPEERLTSTNGWIHLLVKAEDATSADVYLQAQEEKLQSFVKGNTPGARKMLFGGVACMVGLLIAISPNGGPVEGLAWMTVGLGAFQFLRGVYQQREEEQELLGEDPANEEDEGVDF